MKGQMGKVDGKKIIKYLHICKNFTTFATENNKLCE